MNDSPAQSTALTAITTSYVRLAEPRARYRRRLRASQGHNAHAAMPEVARRRAEQRVQQRDGGASWQRILSLSAQLGAAQTREGRALWLALEELLHGYWLDLAAEHYNLGYDAGKAQAWLDATLRERAQPREKLMLLTAALAEVAAQLSQDP